MKEKQLRNLTKIGVILGVIIILINIITLISSTETKTNTVNIKNYEAVQQTTVPSGYTGIYNASDLQAMTLTGNYILMADINMAGQSWTPIGTGTSKAKSFSGIFDGNLHKISNLTINSDVANVGMFGYAYEATIKNLTLQNANVTSSYTGTAACSIGALVGGSSRITIENVNVSGTVKNSSTSLTCIVHMGGIAGRVPSSRTIDNSISQVTVTLDASTSTSANTKNIYVGGLLGYESGNGITNSYSTGNVKVIGNKISVQIGGLVGHGSKITNSYSTGNVEITANATSYVGGLIGEASGEIADSYATGNINVTGNAVVGGLVGDGHSITKSYATGNIKTTSGGVGGLVGTFNETISNSFATGNIETKTAFYAGGLAYEAVSGSTISNCYAVGKIIGAERQCGLIASGSSITVTDSYWTPETTGADTTYLQRGEKRNLSTLLYKTSYGEGWNFNEIWQIEEGVTLPYFRGMNKPPQVNESNYTYTKYRGRGTEANPHLIETEQQLQGLKNDNGKTFYKLARNINISAIANFEPIGNEDYPFKGTLDGAGYTISNLTINSDLEMIGMFGYTYEATIKNLTLKNANITSSQTQNSTDIGVLVGHALGTNIENIKVSGTAKNSSTNSGIINVGGLVGYAYSGSTSATSETIINNIISEVTVIANGTNSIYAGGIVGHGNAITNSYSTGNVKATSSGKIYTGGISGNGITITNSYSTGNIEATGSGPIYAGGLAGSSSISDSYATGNVNVTGTGTDMIYVGGLVGSGKNVTHSYSDVNVKVTGTGTIYAGGLVGTTSGKITNTFALGDITIPKGYAGGLVGSSHLSVSITNSYAVGKIDAEGTRGGIIASKEENYTLTVTNSYWCLETTGVDKSAGTGEKYKSIDDMKKQATFANWDFNTIWKIQEGKTYPYFNNMSMPNSVVKQLTYMEMTKKDNHGNVLEGAKFHVLDSNNNLLSEQISDSNGIFKIYGLGIGNYKLKEIEAPVGYVKDEKEHPFSINNQAVITFEEHLGNTICNPRVKAEHVVIQVKELETKAPVQGVVIGLFNTDGSPFLNEANEQITLTTNEEGKVDFANTEVGTYKYKELSVPLGYTLDDTMYEFTVSDKGKLSFKDNKGIIYNQGPKYNIIIKTVKEHNEEEIRNIQCQIIGTNEAGQEIINTTSRTGAYGNIEIENVSETVNLKITVLEASSTYLKPTEEMQIKIINNLTTGGLTTNKEECSIIDGRNVTIKVPIKEKVTIKLKQYDHLGALANGKYEFIQPLDKGTISIEMEKSIMEFYVQKLPQGTYHYTLKQTETPEGCETMKETTIDVTFDENGNITDVTSNNEKVEIPLHYSSQFEIEVRLVRKPIKLTPNMVTIFTCEHDTNKPIEGAVIQFYDRNEKKLLKSDGSPVQLTTNSDGIVDLSNALSELDAETYVFKQISVPLGYELNTGTFFFDIKRDGTVKFLSADPNQPNRGIIRNQVTKVKVTARKQWEDNSNKYGKRPNSVILKIIANNTEVQRQEVSEENNWMFTANLRKYDDDKNLIIYKVDEEEVNEGDLKEYKKIITNHTVANWFIIPEYSEYTVEHYKQNDTLDGYTLAETEKFTRKTNIIVTAGIKQYEGYLVNLKANGTKTAGRVEFDGSLVLKIYYDIELKADFNVNIKNLDKDTSEPIKGTTYDVIIKYNDGTTREYKDKITDESGNITIPGVLAKNVTRVSIKQTKIPQTHIINKQSKYVDIKVVGINKIALTSNKSSDIIVNLEGNELNIVQLNSKITPINVIRIVAVDDRNNDTKVGNVVFNLTYPDGKEVSLKTNASGIAEIKDIPLPGEGTYTYEIKQSVAPTGYLINEIPVYVNITFDASKTITDATLYKGSAQVNLLTEIGNETKDTIANIVIGQRRDGDSFGDYKIKIIEKDVDTKGPVQGITYSIIQTGISDGKESSISTIKTTDTSGTILEDALNSGELRIKVKRINAIAPYVLIPEEIEIILKRDAEGNYVAQNSVNGVTIDTQNKLIIINREISSDVEGDNLKNRRINNTVYITKVDRSMNVLGNISLELREQNSGDYWALQTDTNGQAKLVVPQSGSEYPSKMITQPGELKYRITEDDVPVGAERVLEEDIGFNIKYEQNPDGGLEITGLTLEDGISYDHIVDLEYTQEEMDTYTQVDIMLKVVNDYAENPILSLNIEKVDEENKNITLQDATFEITLTYPGNGEKQGTLKTVETTNVEGKINVPELRFPRGTTTIEILENVAPNGYVIDKTPTTIKVTNTGGEITVEGAEYNKENAEIDVQISNVKEPKPYNIIIQKRDIETSKIISSTTKFEVTITDSTGVNVKEISTTEGRAKIEGLNSKGAIEVKIKEIEAPKGYQLNNVEKIVTLTKEGLAEQIKLAEDGQEDVNAIEDDIVIDMYDEKSLEPKIKIIKVDEDNSEITLSKAQFQVTFPDNTTKMVTTQNEGEIIVELSDNLSGRYEIEEINPPQGYIASKKVSVDITLNSETGELTQCELITGLGEDYLDDIVSNEILDNTANLTISNKSDGPSYDVIINKVDSISKGGISGAKFDINVKGNIGYSTTKSTSNEGNIEIKELKDTGDITIELQEIQEPKDYIGDKKKKEFKINRDVESKEIILDETSLINIDEGNINIEEQTIIITLENEAMYKNKLIIEDQVLGDPDRKIPGTTFEVEKPDVNLGSEITNNEGIAEINLGQEGTREVEYTIKTTKINNAYRQNEDVILKITYNDGKIENAEIIGGAKDKKDRIVAEIDPSVPYAGQHEMKIIIRNDEFPETKMIIENEDIDDNNLKIEGTTFVIEKTGEIIGSGTTDGDGLTKEISLGIQKDIPIEYKIKNTYMNNKNYKANLDITLRIVYDEDGRIKEAEIIAGSKDFKDRIVAQIDPDVNYIGENEIKIKIRCSQSIENSLKIINENIDKSDEKIAGTKFQVIKIDEISGSNIIIAEEKTNVSGETKEIDLGKEETKVVYLIKNISMEKTEYKANKDVKIQITYNQKGEVEEAKIIEGETNAKGQVVAQIDSTTDNRGDTKISLIIKCEKYPSTKIIIENEDIEDNSIKIPESKFKIIDTMKQSEGETDDDGIIDGIIEEIYYSRPVEFTIENIKPNEKYNKTNQVKLQINFNDEGKIENAKIIEGEQDTSNRVVAEIDPSVNYIGENQIKIKIRSEKKVYISLVIETEDIDDNTIKIPQTTLKVLEELGIKGEETTNIVGLTKEIIIEPKRNEKGNYTIVTENTPSIYKNNDDVGIEITYNQDGKIQSAQIIYGEKDVKQRIVAEIDDSVEYVGKDILKLKVRCEKSEENSEEPGDKEEDNFDKKLGILLEKVSKRHKNIKVVGAEYRITVLNESTGEAISKIDKTDRKGQINLLGIQGSGVFQITIEEMNTPADYIKDENIHTIRINTYEDSTEIEILEEDIGKNVEIRPDKLNEKLKVIVKEASEGIELGIAKKDYDDNKILLSDCKFKITNENTNEELITGSNGMEKIALDLKEPGRYEYKIEEIQVTGGYALLPQGAVTLVIDYEDDMIKSAQIIGDEDYAYISEQTGDYVELNILNKKLPSEIKYDLEIIKSDAYYSNIVLKGAELQIKINNEVGMTGITVVEETDENGKVEIKDICGSGLASIEISELTPPEDRKFDTKVKKAYFRVDEGNNWISLDRVAKNVEIVDLDNDNRKIILRIRNYADEKFTIGADKVETDNEDIKLKGAQYEVSMEGSTETYLLEDKDDIMLLTDLQIPDVSTSPTTFTYILEEKVAPKGYLLDETPIVLKVEVTKSNFSKKITNAYIVSGACDVTDFGEGFVHLKLSDSKEAQIEAKKVWEDNNNKAEKRPSSIILELYQNGEKYKEETLTGDIQEEEWKHNFINLPKYDANGVEYIYTLDEKEVNDGDLRLYDKEIEGTTIKNTFHVPEDKIEIKGTKKWVDNSNEEKNRPESIIIELYQNGEKYKEQIVTGNITENEWKYTFEELPKYDTNADEYIYSIDEKEVNDGDLRLYSKVIEETDIQNTLDKNEIVITKKWVDNDIQKERRPEKIKLQVQQTSGLAPDGVTIATTESPIIVDEKEIESSTESGENGITIQIETFIVPKYDQNGQRINYIVDEAEVNEGDLIWYTKHIDQDTRTITNTFEPRDVRYEATITKIWDDENNKYEKRPQSIIIDLFQGDTVIQSEIVTGDMEEEKWTHTFEGLIKYDENGREIEYHVDEREVNEDDFISYRKKINGNEIINSVYIPGLKIDKEVIKVWDDNNNVLNKRPDKIILQIKRGDEVVASKQVSSQENWKYTFTDLPKYDEDGYKIEYIISELPVNEDDLKFYQADINENTITNTFNIPEDTLQAEVIKKWEDNNNEKGKRPSSIIIELYQNGEKYKEETISGNMEENEWKYVFTDLPQYDSNAEEYVYSIDEKEVTEGDLKFYEKVINGNEIVNTFKIPEDTLQAEIIKKWEDDNNEKGKRPSSIIIELYQNGEKYKEETISGNMKENKWKHVFTGIPKYDSNAEEYAYSIDEKEVTKGDLKFYEKIINGNEIVNTFNVGNNTKSITIRKKWIDENNKFETRPEKIKLLLINNKNEIIGEKEVTEKDNWQATFDDLKEYDEYGNIIEYLVDEKEIHEDDLKFYTKTINGLEITNTLTSPGDKVKITVTKKWEDENNKAGKRPKSIKLQLKQNEEIIREAIVTEQMNWTYTFKDLSKYNKMFQEAVYTIDEVEVNEGDLKFYEKTINGNEIINTFNVPDEKIKIEAIKQWEDENNRYKLRPKSIKILLKANNEIVDEIILTQTNQELWTHTFENLPKYDTNGNIINYELEEKEVDQDDLKYYETQIDGYTIINKFKKERLNFNLKLDKVITGIETNGELKEINNKKMVKKEVKGRKIQETNIQYIYTIKVINESNIPGSAILVEDIPEGLEFVKEQNQNWKEDNGRIIIPINEIKAYETKEYQIKLKWNNDEDNFGKMINTAHLEEVSNVFDVREETTEDNVSSSTIIMSAETGKIKTYSAIISVILIIIAGLATEGRHMIKKKINL